MASNKRVFTLRLSDEVFDKIGALATKQHRSMTKAEGAITANQTKSDE